MRQSIHKSKVGTDFIQASESTTETIAALLDKNGCLKSFSLPVLDN